MVQPPATASDASQPGLPARLAALLRRQKSAYERGATERPLGAYVGLVGLYGLGVALLGLLARASGRRLPPALGAADLALAAVATHKASRVLAKDPVTSPLRAPFTEFAGQSGPAELAEEVRGEGVRRAVGELLT